MPQLRYVAMDQGYDSEQIRQHLQAREVTPGIPPKRHRQKPISYDAEHYHLREQVERCFNKMKHCRRVATRDEKLRQTFLAFSHVVALGVIIR
jgi:transposase